MRKSVPVATDERNALTRVIFESSVIRFSSVSQTRSALTSVAPLIPAVFGPSVAKKPHISLKRAAGQKPSQKGVARLHRSRPPSEKSMTSQAVRPYDKRLKPALLLTLALFLGLSVPAVRAADEPDLIFRRSTV